MRISLSHILTIAMFACTNAACATAQTQWPSSPSRLKLDTPYGDLYVSSSDYVYESRLMLDSTTIQPLVKGMLNIPYAFSSPSYHVALVSISTGDQLCPVTYRWVKLSSSGYRLTSDFGSCSESIKVSADGSVFTLQTPSTKNPDKVDTYTYDGKIVTQHLAR